MKRLISCSLAVLLSCTAMLAQEPVFLFEDFTPATFIMKNNVVSGIDVNFDAKNQKLYYIDGENVMELTNCSDIDTLYTEGRKFLWKNESLCEYIPKDYGSIYINWNYRSQDTDSVANIYYLQYQGQEYKAGQLSDLYRQFPDKASKIKHLAREYGLSMKRADSACKIYDFICADQLPQFSTNDLIGYWCKDFEYNRIPHSVIHFIDGNKVVVYSETDVVNVFHNVVGLQIPGFNGLFYCPTDDAIYGYTINDGMVRISNGMNFKITKKGNLRLEGSREYRKFEQRTFAEVMPGLNDRYGNPKANMWGPVPGLIVSDPNPR